MPNSSKASTVHWSFVALMATLMSFVAFTIDAMLPALGQIGQDLNVTNPNDIQLVISSIFFGMGLGLIFFGPLSDSWGRKPVICMGMGIFILGCTISLFSQSFTTMIIGRLLQGLGAASSRVVTLAMIRDQFSGRAMAKVMSFIMILFILVPALAPSIGQAILLIASWRAIFLVLLSLSGLSVLWLILGQAETLVPEKRLPFSLTTIVSGMVETLKNKTSRTYTLAAGLAFGSFIGYLSSSQQIFQVQYQLGDKFALVFGCLALMIGLSSFTNSKLVDQYGMELLCKKALFFLVILSIIFAPICYFFVGKPPLFLLLLYLGLSFFSFGILFGNFNTLAVEPLGHIAGVASSVISSLQTLIAVTLGGFIGQSYNGTVIPLTIGFFVLGLSSLLLLRRHSHG